MHTRQNIAAALAITGSVLLAAAPATMAEPLRLAIFTGLDAPVGAVEFEEVDADSDGKVTREEARLGNIQDGLFDKLDQDHDGALDPREFREFEPDRSPAMD